MQDQSFNVRWDEGISPGTVWRGELAQAIRGCSRLVFFTTPNSVASEHCTREVNFALDEHHRPVLAVHLQETALPDALTLRLIFGEGNLHDRHLLPLARYPWPRTDDAKFRKARKIQSRKSQNVTEHFLIVLAQCRCRRVNRDWFVANSKGRRWIRLPAHDIPVEPLPVVSMCQMRVV